MKFSRLLIIAILFSITFLSASTARADNSQNQSNSNNKSDNKSNDDNEGGGSSLPINGQAWFLIIAGTVIGIKVVADKSRKLKLSKV